MSVFFDRQCALPVEKQCVNRDACMLWNIHHSTELYNHMFQGGVISFAMLGSIHRKCRLPLQRRWTAARGSWTPSSGNIFCHDDDRR